MKRAETDIHLHLDGSLSTDVVKTLARQIGYDFHGQDIKKCISVGSSCENLEEYLTCFELPVLLLQTEDALELAAYDLMKRLAAQGVVYAEIRFAPQLHGQKGLGQSRVVEAVIRGMNRGRKETEIHAGLILCAMVNGDDRENERTMDVAGGYLGKGVVGADIAGPEGLKPMEYFEPLFRRAYQAGVPFTIHAGESGGYDNVSMAVSFGARRIGHGCAAIRSEACMELLKREHITLEMCVTSNLQTRAAASVWEHPIKPFYEKGIHVTYNTDNMTVSDTTLDKEALLIMKHLRFSEEDLRQMNRYAVEGAFIGEQEKEELLQKLS